MEEGDPFSAMDFPPKFLFQTPLYQEVAVTRAELAALFDEDLRLDGYCPSCGEKRTFRRSKGTLDVTQKDLDRLVVTDEYALRCTRFDYHRIVFFYHLNRGNLQKVGQYPSFADIAIDESKAYTKLLDKGDVAEFHKAIGLAAHGVGIGSLVYVRRIFERLIQKRFDEYKDGEEWHDEDFKDLRMAEKIEFLQKHLPSFLVRNKKLYSILSLGIHELDESACLSFFEVLKMSTIIILEEDKEKKEELERQRSLEKAIANFQHPKAEQHERAQRKKDQR